MMIEDNFKEITAEMILHNLKNLSILSFEVTSNCNFRCKYCVYENLYDGFSDRKHENMDFIYAKQIIDYLCKIWQEIDLSITMPLNVSFYGGEPLLAIDLIKQIINYIEFKCKGIRCLTYSMTTNAFFLDRDIDYLVEKKFSLLISLDGDRQGHSYRVDAQGKDSFDKVCSNIQLVQTQYWDYFNNNVMFNAVLHDRNSVETIFNFINNNFSKVPRISMLKNIDLRENEKPLFGKMYKSFMQSYDESSCKEYLEEEMFTSGPFTNDLFTYLRYYSGNIYQDYKDLLINRADIPIIPSGTCLPFAKKMFVTADGKILQCEKISHRYTLGYVNAEGVFIDFEAIATNQNSIIFIFIKQCKYCVKNRNCPVCILSLSEDELFNGKCRYFTTADMFQKEEINIKAFLYKHPRLYKKLIEKTKVYI